MVLCVFCVSALAGEPGSAGASPSKEAAAEKPELPPPPPAKPPASPKPSPKPPTPEAKPPTATSPKGQPAKEIVVTASRIPTEEKHVGSSVSVIGGEELEVHRPAAVWEALQFTPGVTFVQGGTRGQLTSLFMRGGESDHTLVLLDGFKLNDDGGDFPWETLSPAGFGRVEVLRGAGSALYGAEAMTGVVQVFTEKGSGPPRLDLASEAGTYHTFRETSRLIGAEGPWAYNLSLSRFDMTDGRFPNSDYRATTFAGRIDFDVNSNLHAKLINHTMDDEIGNYESDNKRDPNGRVEHRRDLTGLEFSSRLADRVDSRLLLGRGLTSFFYEDKLDQHDTIYYRTTKDLERTSADWQNTARIYAFGPAVGTLTAGLYWEEEAGKIDSTASGTYFSLPYESQQFIDRSRTTRAAYADKRLELWEALTLDAGVRTEDHSTFGTKTATRLAGSFWLERTGTKLHSSWGQGFKSPTFFENFDNAIYDLGGAPTHAFGNPHLEPERVESIDVGIEQHFFKDRGVAGVTVFRNRFRDFINYKLLPSYDSTYTNAGRARAEGIEYELRLRPVEWARARGSYTLTHTEAITDDSSVNFMDGRPLLRRPEQVYNGIVEVEPFIPWTRSPAWTRRLTVFGEVVRQAGTTDVDWDAYQRVGLKDWTEVNAGVQWEIWKGLRVFGRWDNIFNQEIEQAAGITGTRSSFLGGIGYTVTF